jgi:hypothetical protein
MKTFWLLIVSGIAWWLIVEFLRGRPNCPKTAAFWLTFAGPIGCVFCCVLAFLLKH